MTFLLSNDYKYMYIIVYKCHHYIIKNLTVLDWYLSKKKISVHKNKSV